MNMKTLNSIKKLIKLMGLKRVANYLLGLYAKFFQHHVCIRNGIKYSLDLSETIDFATYFGGWEPETIEFIENNVKKDNYIIEVGANVGIQSLHLAQKVGPNGLVFAFEPTEFASSKLIKNCELNPELHSRIRILKNLVTNGQHSTPISNIRSSWRTDQSKNNDELINPSLAISIDEFVDENQIPKLDIIKIDVDGYDFKVLQGAKKTISKFKPVIYIELGEIALNKQGDSVKDICNLLTDLGYEGRLAKNPTKIITIDMALTQLKTSTHLNAIYIPLN